MTRVAIRTLRPHLTREQAIETLSAGIAGAARRLARGPVRSVATVHVPFGIFQVSVRCGGEGEQLVLGIDLVDGVLDLYRFDPPPHSHETEVVHTRNHVEPSLSTQDAAAALRSRVERLAYQRRGFLRPGHLEIDVDVVDEVIHVPYWVGFFGRAETASLVVVDAVRRRVEGPKVRRLIGEWLRRGRYNPGSFKYGASRRASANSARASS
jgi:hypothetical protein